MAQGSNSITKAINRYSFSRKSRARCWLLLSGLLDVGIDLPSALEMVETSSAAQGDRVSRDVMKDIRHSVRVGQSKEAFLYYSKGSDALIMTQVGQVKPELIFRSASRILELEGRIINALVSALIQPMVLLLVITGFLYMLGTQLFPVLSEFLPREKWNLRIRILNDVSVSAAKNWLGILIGLFLLISTMNFLMRNLVGPIRQILDRIPPFSLYKTISSGSFFIMLTEIARAEVTLNRAELETVAKYTARYEARHIRRIARNLQRYSLSDALARGSEGWPDLELRSISRIFGSRTDGFVHIGNYLEKWLERAEERIKASASILNTFMLLVAAVIILTVGQFIYFDISNNAVQAGG